MINQIRLQVYGKLMACFVKQGLQFGSLFILVYLMTSLTAWAQVDPDLEVPMEDVPITTVVDDDGFESAVITKYNLRISPNGARIPMLPDYSEIDPRLLESSIDAGILRLNYLDPGSIRPDEPLSFKSTVGFQAPNANVNMIYTLPASMPLNGQILQTNAQGELSWTDAPGSASSLISALSNDGVLVTGRYLNLMDKDSNFSTLRAGLIRLTNLNKNGNVGFKAPDAEINMTYTLPATLPQDNQILQTNADGELSWISSTGSQSPKEIVTEGMAQLEFRKGNFIGGKHAGEAMRNSTLTHLGEYNFFLGTYAGYNTVKGNRNVFLGNASGARNVDGSFNTYVGTRAGRFTLGSSNTFIGSFAGYDDTTNDNSNVEFNVSIGRYAGAAETNSRRLHISSSDAVLANAPFASLIYGEFDNKMVRINGAFEVMGDSDGTTIDNRITGTTIFGHSTTHDLDEGTGGVTNTIHRDHYPNYSVWVKDGLVSEDVAISAKEGWADYVFEDDYQLPSLERTESFVKKNRHLEGIPSAAEIADHGWSLAEMDKNLLKKVEELTLHLIAMNKRLEEVEKENKLLKEAID